MMTYKEAMKYGMEVDANDEGVVLKAAISNASHVLEAAVRVA